MDRSLRWRSLFLFGIVAFCVLNLLPTVVGKKSLPSWYTSWFDKTIQLGLDIRGGVSIDYTIALDRAVEDKASQIKHDVDRRLVELNLPGKSTAPTGGDVNIFMTNQADADTMRSWVMSAYSSVVVGRDCPHDADKPVDPTQVCIRVSSDYADSIKEAALKQAIETIRSRIDEKGVAEPTVISKGDDIIVELPGLMNDAADKERIEETKDIIARAAKLEFKLVVDEDPYMSALFKHVRQDPEAKALGITAESDSWHSDEGKKQNHTDYFLQARNKDELIAVADADKYGCAVPTDESKITDGKFYCTVTGRKTLEDYLKALMASDKSFQLAEDRQIAYEFDTPPSASEDHTPFWRTYYLDKAVQLTGSTITDAQVRFDQQTNRPEVIVNFDRSGTTTFGDMTSGHIGWKMAIILDDKVASAPVIQTAITGGATNITMGSGNADEQEKEAEALVTTLKTGSLPAPLVAGQEQTLGPTLGRDAIAKTQVSFALGVLLVLCVMLFVYRFSGIIAIGAMLINLLITMTAMAIFGATLTLPGIAALVLTVGMAVDGNIIIYERIRDELHLGKSVKGAVEIGFARAFTTVLDGHVTTAAAGWVLLQYGSGPIQGFATMLLVGIGTTLFTTTWVSRVFFDWYVAKNKNTGTISI